MSVRYLRACAAFGAAVLLAALPFPSFSQPSNGDSTGDAAGAALSSPLPESPVPAKPAEPASSERARELRQEAQSQLEQQEHQRVAGLMATFNTTTDRHALPLSGGQKFELYLREQSDPWPPAMAGIVAGIGQATGSHPAWGQGARAYTKRYAASYADSSIGSFLGHAVLPSLLHEDPRYFQKLHGSPASRVLWAASSIVWCRRDRGGWGPNYSNVLGNLTGAAIARAYYPPAERTIGAAFQDAWMVSAQGALGAEVIEFWPSLQRKLKNWRAARMEHKASGV